MQTSSERHGIGKWLSSHHCADLRISFKWALGLSIGVAILAITAAIYPTVAPLIGLQTPPVSLAFPSLIQILAALIAANLVYFQFVATSANGRAGVAAVLIGEIRSIANAIDQFGIIELMADGLGKVDRNEDSWENTKRIMGSTNEQYMQAYEKNIDKIANLREDAVTYVSAFYTDLKASRDASRAIGQWSEKTTSTARRSDMLKVLRLLDSCLVHGSNALRTLSENATEDSTFAKIRGRLSEVLKVGSPIAPQSMT